MSDTIETVTLEESANRSREAAKAYLSGLVAIIKKIPLGEDAPTGACPAAKWLRKAIECDWVIDEHHPLLRVHVSDEDDGCPEVRGFVEGEAEAYDASRKLSRHVYRLKAIGA